MNFNDILATRGGRDALQGTAVATAFRVVFDSVDANLFAPVVNRFGPPPSKDDPGGTYIKWNNLHRTFLQVLLMLVVFLVFARLLKN